MTAFLASLETAPGDIGDPLADSFVRDSSVRDYERYLQTNLVRAGNDLVLVAEIAAYRRLETTRRYSLPSAAGREAAMEALRAEH